MRFPVAGRLVGLPCHPYNGQVQETKRTLALDLGTKNIGVAVSDPLGLTAQGLPTLRRTNRRADLARLRELVEALGVSLVVVGHPLHLKGFAAARAHEAERFAEWLRAELQVPVELFDERLTTQEAEQHLRALGRRASQRKEEADRVAATLLLQSYLDRQAAMHSAANSSPPES